MSDADRGQVNMGAAEGLVCSPARSRIYAIAWERPLHTTRVPILTALSLTRAI
jgi:hypothetical protein